jgi:8-oxo-dGTP pyrophosphatase MutT (NUDIX family)
LLIEPPAARPGRSARNPSRRKRSFARHRSPRTNALQLGGTDEADTLQPRKDGRQERLTPALPITRPSAPPIPAAVLVPLHPIAGQRLAVVLTKRRSDLRSHAGEISFPGGRREERDRDLLETALREAREELGLPAADVTVLGELAQTSTFVSNFSITPFVAMVRPGRVWRPSRGEVEAVLELPLEELRSTFARRRLEFGGRTFASETYELEDQLVWGATARILGDLFAWLDTAPASSWPRGSARLWADRPGIVAGDPDGITARGDSGRRSAV